MKELYEQYLAQLQAARDAGLYEGLEENAIAIELLEAIISAAQRSPKASQRQIFLDAMANLDYEIEP